MKNRFKILAGIVLAVCAAGFAACTQEKAIDDGGNEPVRFTTGIATRATAQEWEQGDRVGIFMIAEGSTLSAQSIVEDVANRQYIASAGAVATLTPATSADKIFFPRNGDKVDFIAYHPYLQERDIRDYQIAVDAADQSAEPAIDLLYSDNAVSRSKDDARVNMVFRHVMSKLNVNITLASEFLNESVQSVSFTGFVSEGTFSLVTSDWTTGQVGEVKSFANGNNFFAHMVPQDAAADRYIVIDMGVATYTYPIANDRNLPQNMILTYNLIVGREGVLEAEVTIADWTGNAIDDQMMELPGGQFEIVWEGYNDDDFTAIEIIDGDGNTYATRVELTDEGTSITTDMVEADPSSVTSVSGVSVFYMGRKFAVPAGQFSITDGVLTLDYHEIIAKKEHLEYLSQNFSTKPELLEGNYFQLRDVDLENNPFTPIGAEFNKFNGSYDGGGFVIENLNINLPGIAHVGLFGYCKNTILKNIHVASGSVTGGTLVGGICGYIYGLAMRTEITDCSNSASVSGIGSVAGVCGFAETEGITSKLTISGCENSGTITGANFFIGGICGRHVSVSSAISTITGCTNTGSVQSTMGIVGGICGQSYTDYSGICMISNCTNTGSINGMMSIGGVCGENRGTTPNSRATISGCKNTGTVNGTDYNAGGVCGHNFAQDGAISTITDCVNEGDVEGMLANGGICGAVMTEFAGISIISRCVNTAMITGRRNNVGGVCGENHAKYNDSQSTISNCSNTGIVTGWFDNVGGVCGSNNTDGMNSKATITYCDNLGAIDGVSQIGGLCGYNSCFLAGSATISASTNSGTVTGLGNYIGGVCGTNDAKSPLGEAVISSCANTGTVAGEYAIGGVAGYQYSAMPDIATIVECYSAAKVTGIGLVGGICGMDDFGTSKFCFWSKANSSDTSPQLAFGDRYGGAGINVYEFNAQYWPGEEAYTPGLWILSTAGGKWESLGEWGGSPETSTFPKLKR